MIVYMYYGLLPEIKLSYLILSYNIPNYTMVHKNRLTPTDHGGLIIDVHNQFQCFDVNINLVSNRWEYLCIGLSHRKPRSKKYVICNVYRKPGGTTEEMTTFIFRYLYLGRFIRKSAKMNFAIF